MPKKILLIEDEKVLAEMYQDKIKAVGFDAIWADSAELGLEMLEKEKPDLILLDMLLPKGNGIWFLEQLRKNPETASQRVLAFSNYDDPETKEKASKLKVEDYLIKTGYTPQQIVDRIREYLP